MAELLINPLTKKRLDYFIARPSHALLLQGQVGAGLIQLSNYVRKSLTAGRPDADALVSVEPNDKGTIPIETIRGLSKRLKMHNSSQDISVVTVVHQADSMQAEAQNSLLKLLEEPPQGVLFVLLTEDASRILSTISSRCLIVDVLPVSLEQAQNYFKDTSEAFSRLFRLSGGQPELLQDLRDNTEHPLVQAINEAKQLLAASPFDRLKLIDSSYKKREAAVLICSALLRVCEGGLQSGRASLRWVHNCRVTLEAIKKLEANVQSKIALDQLFLQLR